MMVKFHKRNKYSAETDGGEIYVKVIIGRELGKTRNKMRMAKSVDESGVKSDVG
jgi:hypothetical protein